MQEKPHREALMDNPFLPISKQLEDVLALQRKLLQMLEGEKSDPPEQRRILSLQEFCEYVGISKQTAYKLTSGQKVPHSKRGKRIFFDREKVDEWLLENQVATVSEIQQEANDFIDSTRRKHK